jgi:transcriptional regulator with XRE-family HTH domain
MDFAKRLKSERTRLALTQDNLARAGGVSRRAQVGYEAGTSSPDARYLEGVAGVGVDVFYLATGKRLGDEVNQVAAAEWLLAQIAKALGLRGDSFSLAWEKITALVPAAVVVEGEYATVDSSLIDATAAAQVAEVLSSSPVVLDELRMASVVQAIEEAIRKRGKEVEPIKKSRLVLLAYRQASASGQVDSKLIEEAVALAT